MDAASALDGMGRLEFATPREAWGGEATAFTPYLAAEDMLEYLGLEIGIGPLALVSTEHRVAGGRSLDILAETGDGRRVAIENQYGAADHDHLTRGLAYAVAIEARALIVVAEDHRDEFVSVADYLNDVAGVAGDLGILVWLVKVRAVRRHGDHIWSPEFVVQAEPNDWEAAIRRETGPLLASLNDFYAKTDAESGHDWAEKARRIVEGCTELGMREGHNSKQTVALYADFPDRPGGLNVLQVWTTGYFAICRGYLRDYSGVFGDETALHRLDEEISRLFPDATWPEKKYFISVREPDPETVLKLARWLLNTRSTE